MIRKEKLTFIHFDEDYKKIKTEYEYELQFGDDNKLLTVRNGFGFPVEKKSYAWDYFSKKYGQ